MILNSIIQADVTHKEQQGSTNKHINQKNKTCNERTAHYNLKNLVIPLMKVDDITKYLASSVQTKRISQERWWQ